MKTLDAQTSPRGKEVSQGERNLGVEGASLHAVKGADHSAQQDIYGMNSFSMAGVHYSPTPVCLSVCLAGWLAGWLAGCMAYCLSVHPSIHP